MYSGGRHCDVRVSDLWRESLKRETKDAERGARVAALGGGPAGHSGAYSLAARPRARHPFGDGTFGAPECSPRDSGAPWQLVEVE